MKIFLKVDIIQASSVLSLMIVIYSKCINYPIYTCTLAMAERGSVNTGRALP